MTEYQKREIARISGEAETTLKEILSRVTEFSADSGTATGGSQTELVDSTKNWETNMWKDAVIEVYSVADDIYYLRTISANDATKITMAALPGGKSVVSGDPYAIRLTVGLADINKWAGTSLTGRDISLDLKALIDDSIKGVLRSLSDIGSVAGEDDMGLLERIGELKASPTANTVLDRLKDIETAIGTLTPAADTPVIYNVTMTLADTEYSQALPANTKKYTIQTRDGTAFRIAFETGKVAAPTEPYFSIGIDGFHHEDSINPASLTLYFACGEAGKVAEILAWS